MSGVPQVDYDEAMRAMAVRNDSLRLSWRASRTSPLQSTRRHSARIEKPRSHHPSPRTPDRRRTTASSRHYSAMEDHYRRMMGWDDIEEPEAVNDEQYYPTMRPVSWHPGSSTMSDMYGQASTAEPSPTSQYLSYQNSPFHQHVTGPVPAPQSAWSSYMHGDFQGVGGQTVQQDLTSWFDNGNSQTNSRITSTWTEPEEGVERRERESSVELIGLGLYDEPGFTVKIGSKLEEECDPPDFEVDDDEEEESEEEEELPKPEDAKTVQSSLPLDMSGRSFFVGPHEALESTWWPGSESKQPQATVSSVSYGWI